jgi:hypothetical protein
VHEMQYIKDYISNPFLSIKLILRFDWRNFGIRW